MKPAHGSSPCGIPQHLAEVAEQIAATRRFSLGVARAIAPAADGSLRYVRSRGPRDPVSVLWMATAPDGDGDSVATMAERVLVDPDDLVDLEAPSQDADAEQARRQRARELATGITAWDQDDVGELIAFVVAGRLFTHVVATGVTSAHPTATPVYDARLAPDASAVCFVADGQLHMIELDHASAGQQPWVLCAEDGVQWGVAEFVAAEEMGRLRGYWWSPDSRRIAVSRVDEQHVEQWHLSDPAMPHQQPRQVRYPAAGTANADVRLAIVDRRGGPNVDVSWDRQRWPYLARVMWDRDVAGLPRLTVTVQSRDQTQIAVLAVDANDGSTRVVRTIADGGRLELVAGSPAWAGDQLVTVEDDVGAGSDGTRRLLVDGVAVTDPPLQVRSVVAASADSVVFTASDEPTRIAVWMWSVASGLQRCSSPDGVFGAVAGHGVLVIVGADAHDDQPTVTVGPLTAPARLRRTIEVIAERPKISPQPRMLRLGSRDLRAALYVPSDQARRELPIGDADRLPVVLDPYGGPHAQRVLDAGTVGVGSQWLADHGFAVLVIDGRGTPGRGPLFERAVHGDFAGPVLQDQLDGLDAACVVEPRLDRDRVGIRGWSFGGYLAALAAIRAPDRIRAAVAGAPVTDWRLYDTHYTERYLGHPDQDPEAYRRSSLIDSDGRLLTTAVDSAPNIAAHVAPDSLPPILIMHGFLDDNVVMAHSVRLAAGLFKAGWPHHFVPLGSVTHFSSDVEMTRVMAQTEVDFLRQHLQP